MANFAQTIDLNGLATFTASSRIRFGFQADNLIMTNRGASAVEYSFDGVAVHGRLEPSNFRTISMMDFQRTQVFFRTAAVIANLVDVEAVQQ
jgi:hypothetical protein